MHLFDMRGAWGATTARIYDAVIGRGIEPLHERVADAAVPRLPAAGRFLDVGCGAGRMTAILARRLPGASLEGVDLSGTMVSLARSNAGRLPNVRFRQADAMNLPYGDGEFDGALSVASIKHWPDRARGVAEMARVVRPGGTLMIVEADRECTKDAADRFVAHWRNVLPPFRPLASLYFRRFVAGQGLDAGTLRSLLESAGLAAIEAASERDQPAVWAVGSRPVARAT